MGVRLVSWNVLAGGGPRCGAIIARLQRCGPDHIVLQEILPARRCRPSGTPRAQRRRLLPRPPKPRLPPRSDGRDQLPRSLPQSGGKKESSPPSR